MIEQSSPYMLEAVVYRRQLELLIIAAEERRLRSARPAPRHPFGSWRSRLASRFAEAAARSTMRPKPRPRAA